jgi:hypothetical protein
LTCAASTASFTYTLTNPFATNDYAATTTNLQIKIGTVTNPDVSGSPGTFTVQTYLLDSSTYYLVDQNTYSSVSITTGAFTSLSVTPSSFLAYDTAVSYTIGFTTQHSVVMNGYITITFPSEISITDTSAAVSGCLISINGGTTNSVCTAVSSTQFRFTGLFSSGKATGSIVAVIPGVRNPRSLATSSSFTVTTSDNSLVAIDTLATGFTTKMTSTSDLQSVSVSNTATLKINGNTGTYQIIVTVSTPPQNGDRLKLQFPTAIGFPVSASTLSCSPGSNVTAISCSMNSSNKTITATITTFTTTVTTGNQFDFTVTPLTNAFSLTPAFMQSISLVDSSDTTINGYAAAGAIEITNTDTNVLTAVSLGQTTDVAGNSAIYTFTFTPTNAIPQHAIIKMIYPSTVTPSSSKV